MRRRSAVLTVAILLLCAASAWAHRLDEYLQATIITLHPREMQASMRLIPGVLVAPSLIAAIDSNHDGVFSPGEEQAYATRVLADVSLTLDGKTLTPQLRSWHFPSPAEMRNGLGEIKLDYIAALPPGETRRSLILSNHHQRPSSVYLMNVLVPEDPSLRVLAQKRNESQSVYQLDYQQTAIASTSREVFHAWLNVPQLGSLFRLGMRHIAEGTDHLLFLLVLLLPAPLLAAGSRWGKPTPVRESLLRILAIVTSFTIGHSITLSLAAMNLVRAPERPVEILIAVSILVSAIHALRPIFPGRESWIAAFFGLFHGLAFAATLDRLGLSHWQRVAGILAFNLGIETMQLLVVAAILPSLLLLSQTGSYPIVRRCGALLAAVSSVGWIAERLFGIDSHVDTVINAFARHPVSAALTFFILSLACRYLPAISPAKRSAQSREALGSRPS